MRVGDSWLTSYWRVTMVLMAGSSPFEWGAFGVSDPLAKREFYPNLAICEASTLL